MSGDRLLTMTNAQPGREAEFADWYATRHLDDLVSVPAVTRGRLHTALDERPARWRHAAVYDLADEGLAGLSQIFEYGAAGKMARSDAIDPASVMMAIASPITQRLTNSGAPAADDALLFLVLTNAVAGRDDEFNDWYTGRHIPDLLRVPGFIAAQRYRLIGHSAMPAPPWSYLAFYEVARDRRREAFDGLAARRGSPAMPTSEAMDRPSIEAALYEPVATRSKAA